MAILLVVIGTYILNFKKARSINTLLKPFSALLNESGSRLALLVAVIFSIVSNLDRYNTVRIGPYTVLMIGMSLVTFWHWLIITFILRQSAGEMIFKAKSVAPLGFLQFLTSLGTVLAFSLVPAPYVVAVRRSEVLMGFLAGYLFFQEKATKEKFFGSIFIIVGVSLLAIFQ